MHSSARSDMGPPGGKASVPGSRTASHSAACNLDRDMPTNSRFGLRDLMEIRGEAAAAVGNTSLPSPRRGDERTDPVPDSSFSPFYTLGATAESSRRVFHRAVPSSSSVEPPSSSSSGQGPFWSSRHTPLRAGPNPVDPGAGRTSGRPYIWTHGLNLLRGAFDIPCEQPIPDSEITAVCLETREQRHQWRDFLSDAVSQSRANTLFASFDVEASPGDYTRPPNSSLWSRSDIAGSPHVVAPWGAGFSVGQSCSADMADDTLPSKVSDGSVSRCQQKCGVPKCPHLQEHGGKVGSDLLGVSPPAESRNSPLFYVVESSDGSTATAPARHEGPCVPGTKAESGWISAGL